VEHADPFKYIIRAGGIRSRVNTALALKVVSLNSVKLESTDCSLLTMQSPCDAYRTTIQNHTGHGNREAYSVNRTNAYQLQRYHTTAWPVGADNIKSSGREGRYMGDQAVMSLLESTSWYNDLTSSWSMYAVCVTPSSPS
jgi:hypothetical protein